ncbi:hypothetical protein ACWD0Z_33880 [Streptomyces sp. NPDC003007]
MPQPHEIKITVTSALAEHPYQHDYDPQVTATSVLSDSLTAFSFTSDGTTRYYLFHNGHEVPPEATVGERLPTPGCVCQKDAALINLLREARRTRR